MKKVISMLLFVATALVTTSCDDVEDLFEGIFGDGQEVEYNGTTTVSSYGVTIYTQEDSTYILEEDEGTISIEMDDVKFNAGMPAMDIKISNIPVTDGLFSIDSVIPTLEGVPMESYTISEVSGNYNSSSLTIDFVCLTLDVNFTGSIEE
ncbi:MAG: calycin-like domain-containing protein [Rikenellaceae bacterium]